MKLKNIVKLMAFPLVGLLFTSCLDFDVTGAEFNQTEKNVEKITRQGEVDIIKYDVNLNEEQFDEAMLKIRDNMATALGGVYAIRGGKDGSFPLPHQYQYLTTFYQDAFAQYAVIPHVNYPYSGINIVSTTDIDLKAYGGAYGAFQTASKNLVPLLNMEEVDLLPEIKATYLLFYDYAAVEVADNYGPFPYQDFKTNKQKRPFTYDNLEVIYNTVVENIDTIVKCYEHYEANRPDWYKEKLQQTLPRFTRCSLSMQTGKVESLDLFKRFANSLKLRMAMHIVKVDPDKAKKWAEEAVASGVIEEEKDEISFNRSVTGGANPMVQIWNEWNDLRMGAGLESVLRAYNHPYLEMLFTKNEKIKHSKDASLSLEANTKVCGILAGAHVGQEQGSPSNPYNGFSKLELQAMNNAPLYLMKLSEVCFLRAEGAVRGWDMKGTAQQFYEEGIRHGNVLDRQMQLPPYKGMYEAALDKYMNIEKAEPFTYVDPTGNDADQVSQITVGVKWNDADDREIKLEKIITQKYIAGFPNSIEAWVDIRRTGYPRLFPILNVSDGDGSLNPGDIVRRLPFPDTQDQATLQDVLATGLKALGAADKQATRLWWDVEKDNF